jgi:hypothetical protein
MEIISLLPWVTPEREPSRSSFGRGATDAPATGMLERSANAALPRL